MYNPYIYPNDSLAKQVSPLFYAELPTCRESTMRLNQLPRSQAMKSIFPSLSQSSKRCLAQRTLTFSSITLVRIVCMGIRWGIWGFLTKVFSKVTPHVHFRNCETGRDCLFWRSASQNPSLHGPFWRLPGRDGESHIRLDNQSSQNAWFVWKLSNNIRIYCKQKWCHSAWFGKQFIFVFTCEKENSVPFPARCEWILSYETRKLIVHLFYCALLIFCW